MLQESNTVSSNKQHQKMSMTSKKEINFVLDTFQVIISKEYKDDINSSKHIVAVLTKQRTTDKYEFDEFLSTSITHSLKYLIEEDTVPKE